MEIMRLRNEDTWEAPTARGQGAEKTASRPPEHQPGSSKLKTIPACAYLGITNLDAKCQDSAYTAPSTPLAAKQQEVSHSAFLRAVEA